MNVNLQSLQGWLRVYLAYLLLSAALTAIWMARGLMDGYGLENLFMSVLGLGLLVFVTYALTQTGRPWVRTLHIALNGITVAVLLANMMGLPVFPYLGWIVMAPLSGLIYLVLPFEMIQPIYMIISGSSAALVAAWTGYWAMSVRVRDVYLAPVPAPGAASPNVSPDAASDTAPDAPQEAAPLQDGYITEEDAAQGYAHQSARPNPVAGPGSPVSKPGMSNLQKGCLIALGLLLAAGLIFAAMVFTVLDAWFG